MWGKNKQKRHPRYLEWRLVLGWDYVASLRFPFLRGPSAIMKQNRRSAAQKRRFLYAVDPYESKLSTALRHTKKSHNIRCAICFWL